jgi:hypothetical protein
MRIKSDLKVPLAKDSNGIFICPKDAVKGDQYFCPGCNDEVIFNKGKIKQPYFSHKVSDNCSNETIIHKTAKGKIVQIVTDYCNNNADSPLIVRACPDCSKITEETLSTTITSAEEEKKLNSGYIADVVIKEHDDIELAVEIKVTHAVDKTKETNIGVPFLELSGASIVEFGMRWIPLLDRLGKFECQHCEDSINKHMDLITQIADATDVTLPGAFFRTSYLVCWKCRKYILVFSWPHELYIDKEIEKIKPRTIQTTYSKAAGHKYKGNICPFCDSLQGDFYLYNEPDGPFFEFNCGDNNPESFQEDMKSLAIIADRPYRRMII